MIPYWFFGKGTLKIAQVKKPFQAHDEAWVGTLQSRRQAPHKRKLNSFGEVRNYGRAETGLRRSSPGTSTPKLSEA